MNKTNEPYSIQGSRVFGNGHSYNLNNKHDAIQLYNTLNYLTLITQTYGEIDKKLDKVTKQIIQIKLSIGTLEEEIQQLTEMMK